MKIKIAQVLGLNTDQKAAQVTSLVRDGDQAFFAVLQLTSDDAFTKGRLVLSELSDFYFEMEGGAADKLKSTYEEADKKLMGVEFDILLAAVSGKVLYFIGQDNVSIFLKRDDKISSLFSIGAPAQLVSGFLQAGDRVFFATKNLVDFLSGDLDKTLNLPLETFEQDLTDRVGAASLEGDGLAALLIELEQDEAVEQPIASLDQEPASAIPVREIVRQVLTKALTLLRKIGSMLPKSNRGRLVLGILLLLLLAMGTILQFRSIKDKEKTVFFNQALQGAKDDFNTAKSLANLNPAEAKIKLDFAKENVSRALSLKPDSEEAKNLKTQIDQESGSILKQSTVSEFPLFLDLDLVKKGFAANWMSLSANKLLLLDPQTKTLVSIDISKKSHQVLAGESKLGDAAFASLNGNLVFVFSRNKGILRLDITNQEVKEVAKQDEEWGAISDLYGFAGNVYLLDEKDPSTDSAGSPQAGSGQVWKYLPTQEGYSDKREYLTESTKADFAGSIRMQIESSIYVLRERGEMLRFTKGAKDYFGYEALPGEVKNPKSFFVSSDTDNLYLLDSGNARLLILTKTGSYKGQVEGEKFATATDLVVDEVGKKVYLLEGSKIFQIDLK